MTDIPPSPPPQTSYRRRRIKLIEPELQLKMVGAFAGVTVLALLAQYLVFAARLSELAAEIPAGGPYLSARLPGFLGEVLTAALLIVLPAVFVIGIRITFRTAGPIYRMKRYLEAYARGDAQGPCRIRENDELQDLCALINGALEHAREEPASREDARRAA